MTKVAFIHNNFPAGGAERVTIDIADYLHDVGGYEVYVFATRINEVLISEQMRSSLKLCTIPSQAIPSKRSAEIERLIVSEGIDILVQVTKAIHDIEGIRQRTGCKVILACHGEPFWQRHAIMHRRRKKRLMWWLFNKRRYQDGTLAMKMAKDRSWKEYLTCDAYTVLCEAYKNETAAVFGIDPADSHLYAIENPERKVEDVNYDKENIILFCGRFENWSKRIDRLLRIWGKVQDRLPDWKLVLVGDGPADKMLRQLAVELGLERISFEGRQSDVASYYRKASIVCLTSETEGWVLTLTEAQAQGCIGVAFGATSGIREILGDDEKCGYVVPPFDEDAYADTLLRIAAMSKEQQNVIRKAAVERRLAYTPEIIARKWQQLFDSMIK